MVSCESCKSTARQAHNPAVAGSLVQIQPPQPIFKKRTSPKEVLFGFQEVGVESIEGYRVYVLRNAEGRRYIGVTDDVDRRLAQHNQGVSEWTRGKGPWDLEWSSTPRSLGDARALENLMKRQKGGSGLDRLLRIHGSSGS